MTDKKPQKLVWKPLITVPPGVAVATGFRPSELKLSYVAFTDLVRVRRPALGKDVLEWLGAWEAWDLACSPMDDNERKLIRYGHYLGWFAP